MAVASAIGITHTIFDGFLGGTDDVNIGVETNKLENDVISACEEGTSVRSQEINLGEDRRSSSYIQEEGGELFLYQDADARASHERHALEVLDEVDGCDEVVLDCQDSMIGGGRTPYNVESFSGVVTIECIGD